MDEARFIPDTTSTLLNILSPDIFLTTKPLINPLLQCLRRSHIHIDTTSPLACINFVLQRHLNGTLHMFAKVIECDPSFVL